MVDLEMKKFAFLLMYDGWALGGAHAQLMCDPSANHKAVA
jgi:hypothetical protein